MSGYSSSGRLLKPAGLTNGQQAFAAVDELTRQRQRLAELQQKKQQQQITQNEDNELAFLMGQLGLNKGGKRSKKRRTNKRRRRNSRRRTNKRRKTSRSQKGGYTPEEINNSAKKVYETFRELPEIMDEKLQIMLKSEDNDTKLDFKMKNAYFVHIFRTM
jgi:hypothetical protein